MALIPVVTAQTAIQAKANRAKANQVRAIPAKNVPNTPGQVLPAETEVVVP